MAYLIFDYDGTIFDSMGIYGPSVRAVQAQFAAEGLLVSREISEEELRSYLGITTKQMWERFAPELSEEQRLRGGRLIGEELKKRILAGEARLFEGAVPMLQGLRQAGHRIVYLSNCAESYMKLHTKTFALDQIFDEMYCCEQFGWSSKPDIVRELMARWQAEMQAKKRSEQQAEPEDGRRAGQQPGTITKQQREHQEEQPTSLQVIAIGDRYLDVAIGREVGIPSIFCAYGYGTAEEGKDASRVANRVQKILECVEHILESSSSKKIRET